MEKIEIKQTIVEIGFVGKAVEHVLEGVVFGNGKVAYVNRDDAVCSSNTEKELVKVLKDERGCSIVDVVHKY